MVKRRVVQKGGSVAREIAEEAGRKLTGGIKRHTPPKPRERLIGDDWGFTPKPGEISGTKYMDIYDNAYSKVPESIAEKRNYIPDSSDSFLWAMDDASGGILGQVENDVLEKMFKTGKIPQMDWEPGDFAAMRPMYAFADLEVLGVPRQYTGKLVRNDIVVRPDNYSSSQGIPDYLQGIGLRNVAVEDLKRVPVDRFDEWVATIDSGVPARLAVDVMLLDGPAQQVARRLAPEWLGRAADLVDTARILSGA